LVGIFNDNAAALPFDALASGTCRCKEPQLIERKIAFCEQCAHDASDLTGGSDYSYSHGKRG
jgi:hypothetical protein